MLEIVDFFIENPTLIIVLLVWNYFWKGKALWKAAKSNSIVWFIILLFVNTLGALEMIYLYISNKPQKKHAVARSRKRN